MKQFAELYTYGKDTKRPCKLVAYTAEYVYDGDMSNIYRRFKDNWNLPDDNYLTFFMMDGKVVKKYTVAKGFNPKRDLE